MNRKRTSIITATILAAFLLLAQTVPAGAQSPYPPSGYYGRWGWNGTSLLDATAAVTGLTTDEIISALQTGQTYAQIATDNGIDPQTIIDYAIAQREATLSEYVARGWMSQEQVDLILGNMTTALTWRIQQPIQMPGYYNGGFHPHYGGHWSGHWSGGCWGCYHHYGHHGH
jgi:DNA-binding CsgD family transcriptional regulator